MNDKLRINHIQKYYDAAEYAERNFKPNPFSTLYDWMRYRDYHFISSFLDSYTLGSTKHMALDIGCSSSRYVKLLTAKGFESVGIDTAHVPLTYALKGVPEGNFLRSNIVFLPFKKESFDMVIVMDLFHHLTDEFLKLALTQIAEVTKSGGVFVFNIKKKWNPILYWSYRRNDRVEFTLKARSIPEFLKIVESKGFKAIKKRESLVPFIPFPPHFAPFVVVFVRKK